MSVIVPVYNGEDYLFSTIDSIIKFSGGFRVECIVIDDGSDDSTPEILQNFESKIRIFRQDNAGEGAAVNRGLVEAQGNYILVVSADDPLFTSEIFSGVVDFFKANPEVTAWYPRWQIIDAQGQVRKVISPPEYDFRLLYCENRVLPGPGTWFRRDSALKISGRNSKWKFVGDYDFWLRLTTEGDLCLRPELVAQWRMHIGSTSISMRGPEMAIERMDVINEFTREHTDELPGADQNLARANSKFLAAKLGFFSSEVNSRVLFWDALKIDRRVLRFNRILEIMFMITFPVSKNALDVLRFLVRQYAK